MLTIAALQAVCGPVVEAGIMRSLSNHNDYGSAQQKSAGVPPMNPVQLKEWRRAEYRKMLDRGQKPDTIRLAMRFPTAEETKQWRAQQWRLKQGGEAMKGGEEKRDYDQPHPPTESWHRPDWTPEDYRNHFRELQVNRSKVDPKSPVFDKGLGVLLHQI